MEIIGNAVHLRVEHVGFSYVAHAVFDVLGISACDNFAHDRIQVVLMTEQQWKEQVQGRPSFFAVAGHLSGPKLDVTRGFIALQPDQCEDLGPELTISEWFAGAFAGWHRAVHALKRVLKRKANIRVLWSIDVDPHASHVYAENFGAEQRSRDRAFQKGCVFHHCQDVVQHDWISALEATPTDFAFASPPCQCWSSAGWATGLLHKFGPVVLHSVMKLAYIRPHVIGLENVQGLRRHDHWPALLSLFEYVGFDLIWENEVNLLDVLPQKRTRYLAIFRDRYRRGATRPQFADWFANAPVSLGQADVVLPSEIARTLGCDISPEVLSKYQDPRFIRGGNVMSRIKQFRDVFGCIMASYRHSHELPDALLLEKGLHGDLFLQDGTRRFLTHVEMILLQGGTGTFHLTGNDSEISRIIGNCIAVPHAALVIANALTCTERGMQIAVHPEKAVQAVLGLRLRASHIHIERIEGGFALSPVFGDTRLSGFERPLTPTIPFSIDAGADQVDVPIAEEAHAAGNEANEALGYATNRLLVTVGWSGSLIHYTWMPHDATVDQLVATFATVRASFVSEVRVNGHFVPRDAFLRFYEGGVFRLHETGLHGGVNKRQIQAKLAQCLVDCAFTPLQVSELTGEIIQKAGETHVQGIIELSTVAAKNDAIRSLCKDCNIALQKGNVHAKAARNGSRVNKRAIFSLDPGQYVIQAGFFLNADGTPAQVLADLCNDSTGVVLTTPAKVRPCAAD